MAQLENKKRKNGKKNKYVETPSDFVETPYDRSYRFFKDIFGDDCKCFAGRAWFTSKKGTISLLWSSMSFKSPDELEEDPNFSGMVIVQPEYFDSLLAVCKMENGYDDDILFNFSSMLGDLSKLFKIRFSDYVLISEGTFQDIQKINEILRREISGFIKMMLD